jgi:hypothetical protein
LHPWLDPGKRSPVGDLSWTGVVSSYDANLIGPPDHASGGPIHFPGER